MRAHRPAFGSGKRGRFYKYGGRVTPAFGGTPRKQEKVLTFFCLLFLGKFPHEIGFPLVAYLLSLAFDIMLIISRRTKHAPDGYNEPPADITPPNFIPPAPPIVKDRRR